MEELVRVSGLKYTYPDGTVLHFRGIDFVVRRGEKVVLLGPNGSGKSTLIFHLLGLLKASQGTIRVFGVDPARDYTKIRERIGVLIQNVEEQIIAPTVWDDVSFSLRNYGYRKDDIERMVEEVLEKLDIKHLKDKVPHYLSGGEKTKVGLAGALVTKPELLILDEPFEGLDPVCRTDLIHLLNNINRENGTAILLSTHNIDTVPLIADTVYIMAAGGEIVTKGSPKEIFAQLDLLSRSHIEPPVLGSLFFELKKYGIELDISLTVEEAAKIIADEIMTSRKKTLHL
ncbi:MAG: cobalt ABC transporter ATP-binding protein [Deltaproteobacteria bacterium]|nr:MAG: cobalt ABC transporter ATP-binding protein [Deltaproteobacteria bacterium]